MATQVSPVASRVLATVKKHPEFGPLEVVERLAAKEGEKPVRDAVAELVSGGILEITVDWKLRVKK
jgi:hypothetical protein